MHQSQITLRKGDSYFSIDGHQGFIFSRNVTGKTQADFDTLLDWTSKGGSKLIRVHLTHGWWGDPWITKDGSVNETWAKNWDRFFDSAYARGIYILPVFGVWADWNNGTPDWGQSGWQYNPLNAANGGPVSAPGELFLPDSTTQELWLRWVRTLVERWQQQGNIAAWEVFSEINIASGAPGQTDAKGGVSEVAGVDITNRAAAVIRNADPKHRPVTLSLAGVYQETDQWAEYYHLKTLDFISIHPYTGQLDRELVSNVRQKVAEYQKPVLIGESGLWGKLAIAERAWIGVKHAIWAAMVSGAMNGRALWGNDGYAVYDADRELAFQFMGEYATAERAAADFASGVDFSGFRLLPVGFPGGTKIWGAAIGNETTVVGWFRDANCEPPDWKLQPVISGQTVTLTLPGSASGWRVDFYTTKTGIDIIGSIKAVRNGNTITVTLPDFTDDIAFKMYAKN
jgi:hypothetical protein